MYTSFQKYLHAAKVNQSPADLEEIYDTMDFADLCVARAHLDKIDLLPEERQAVEEADCHFAAIFTEELLQLYADYFPAFPVRTWWGR